MVRRCFNCVLHCGGFVFFFVPEVLYRNGGFGIHVKRVVGDCWILKTWFCQDFAMKILLWDDVSLVQGTQITFFFFMTKEECCLDCFMYLKAKNTPGSPQTQQWLLLFPATKEGLENHFLKARDWAPAKPLIEPFSKQKS